MKYSLRDKYLRLLDYVAPLESWLAALLFSEQWISRLARHHVSKNLRKASLGSILRSILKKDQFAISLPENSVKSVVIASIVVFGIPFVWIMLSQISFSPFPVDYSLLNAQLLSTLQIAWQVLASLIGITFVVVVFVLQYANERKYDGLASPLFFVETKIVFAVSIGLLTMLYFGIISALAASNALEEDLLFLMMAWSFILFIFNIFLALYVFVKAIRIVTPNYFREKFRSFIGQRITDLVGLEIEERFSDLLGNDFLQKLDLESPYFVPEWNKNVKVKLQNLPRQIQVVTDVNIQMLRVVVKRGQKLLSEYKKHDVIFLGRKYHRVGHERPEIALVHEELDRPLITEFIQRSVKYQAIEKSNKGNLADEIVLNGKLIKDAIEARDTNMVEELLDHYLYVIEVFLEAINTYGLASPLDSTRRQSSSFSNWTVLSVIEDQYTKLVDYALRSSDENVLRSFLTFPFRALALALRFRDHLVFRRVLALIPFVYRRSLALGEPSKQKSVVDYCVDNIIGIRRFNLEFALEHADTIDEINVLFEYLIQYYILWHDLLKIAIDSRDLRQFELLCRLSRQTLSRFLSKIDELRLDQLEMNLKYAQDEELGRKLKAELEHARHILALRIKLKEIQSNMFFGVGAWLTHLFDKESMTLDQYVSFISNVNTEYSSVENLHSTYLSSREEKYGQIFDWATWETNDWVSVPGDVSSGPLLFSTWTLLYYSVRGIELASQNSGAFPKLTLSYLNQSVYDGVQQQTKYLVESERWKNLITKMTPNSITEKIASFLYFHQLAIREQEIKDEEDMRDAVLDEWLVKQFRDDVITAWSQNSTLRRIFQIIGRYKVRRDLLGDEANTFGISDLSLKGEFVATLQDHFFNRGDTFGRELANRDDHQLTIPILSSQSWEYDVSEFSNAVLSAVNRLQLAGYSPIILVSHGDLTTRLHDMKEFTSRWRLKDTTFNDLEIFGKLEDGTYVFDVNSIPSNNLIIVDITAFGILSQYMVPPSRDFPLSINVRQLTEMDAEIIVQKNQSWNKHARTGEEVDHDAAIRQILQYVSIQILGNCEIEEINLKSAIRIVFNNVDKVNP